MGKRIGIYLIGLAINALGIALIIYSAVGAGAWDTVAIGLNQSWGLTIGICTVIIQVLSSWLLVSSKEKGFSTNPLLPLLFGVFS